MAKKYIIKKNEKSDSITYMEYEKREGLKMKPKHKISFEDMINVNEIIIINPSLIKKLISKKVSKHYKRIVNMCNVVYNDDDDTGYDAILGEISRLKGLINNKYKKYMEEKEHEMMIKKLEILKDEITYRKQIVLEKEIEYSRRSSR